MRNICTLSFILLAMSACQTDQPVPVEAEVTALPINPEAHTFAQAACGSCHGVERFGLSPNPAAPEFAVIANRGGLTDATLRYWLVNAHNYPEQMDFYLDEEEVNLVVEYLLTLRDPRYTLPPS